MPLTNGLVGHLQVTLGGDATARGVQELNNSKYPRLTGRRLAILTLRTTTGAHLCGRASRQAHPAGSPKPLVALRAVDRDLAEVSEPKRPALARNRVRAVRGGMQGGARSAVEPERSAAAEDRELLLHVRRDHVGGYEPAKQAGRIATAHQYASRIRSRASTSACATPTRGQSRHPHEDNVSSIDPVID